MNFKTIIEDNKTIIEESNKTIVEESIESQNNSSLEIKTFQDYQILQQLKTSGAEADIYIIFKNNQKFILKLYRFGIKPKKELTERLKKLSDNFPKDIVKIYEASFDTFLQRVYEIQEFAKYGSIKSLKNEQLKPKTIKHIIAEIIKILNTLHKSNIIHRDLKPDNILIRDIKPLDLVMTDFGISSMIDEEVSKIMTTKSGTRLYFAPESFSGVIGKEVDYWALGIIILELLTKTNPFKGVDEGLIAYTIHTKGVSIPNTIEEEFKYLLRGLLTRNPKNRWGFNEVVRWLKKERNIPNFYEGGEECRYQKPYIFERETFYNLKELVTKFIINEEFWESGKAHFFRGYITKWLESNEDFDNSVKIDKIKEEEDKEFGFIKLIYSYNEELDFTLFSKLINEKNLLLFLQKYINNVASKNEKSIIENLLKGRLYNYYQEYLKITQKNDKMSFVLKEIGEYYTKSDFLIGKKEKLEKLKNIFKYLEFLNSKSRYYLPVDYQKLAIKDVKYMLKKESFNVLSSKYIVSNFIINSIKNSTFSLYEYKNVSILFERLNQKLIEKNFFKYIQKEYFIPKYLIDNLKEGDVEKFEEANSLILKNLQQNLFITKEEFQDINQKFTLIDNLKESILNSTYSFKVAKLIKKLQTLREDRVYIPKDFNQLLKDDFYFTVGEIDNFIAKSSFDEIKEKNIIPKYIIDSIKEGNFATYKKAKEDFNKLHFVSKKSYQDKKNDFLTPEILEREIEEKDFDDFNLALFHLSKLIENDIFLPKDILERLEFVLPEYIIKYIRNGEYDIDISNRVYKLLSISKNTHFIPIDFEKKLQEDFYKTCDDISLLIKKESVKNSFLSKSLIKKLNSSCFLEYKNDLDKINQFLVDKEFIEKLQRNQTFLDLLNIKIDDGIDIGELREIKRVENCNVSFNYFIKLDTLLKQIPHQSPYPVVSHLQKLHAFSIVWEEEDKEIIDYILNIKENIKSVPEQDINNLKYKSIFVSRQLLALTTLFIGTKAINNLFALIIALIFFIPIYIYIFFKIDDFDLFNLYFNKQKLLLKNVDKISKFRQRIRDSEEVKNF